MKIIGQCSLCKGPVGLSQLDGNGAVIGSPTCQSCGAVQKLPVIEMTPPVKKSRETKVYRGVRKHTGCSICSDPNCDNPGGKH